MDTRTYQAFQSVEDRHWWFRARRDLLAAVLASRVPPGGYVFDVGCGTGYFLAAVKAAGYRIGGFDPEPTAIETCLARGLTGVERASITDLGRFEGIDADAVCFFDVLEHLDDDLAALRGAMRMLKPGGTLLATVPAYRWLWTWHDDYHHHRRRYVRSRLQSVLREAGFREESVRYFNTYLLPLAVAYRGLVRFRTPDPAGMLQPPAAPINRLLERVFRAEQPRLLTPGARGFPFGLSLLAVAERPA